LLAVYLPESQNPKSFVVVFRYRREMQGGGELADQDLGKRIFADSKNIPETEEMRRLI
jgi:hypothetical protein